MGRKEGLEREEKGTGEGSIEGLEGGGVGEGGCYWNARSRLGGMLSPSFSSICTRCLSVFLICINESGTRSPPLLLLLPLFLV